MTIRLYKHRWSEKSVWNRFMQSDPLEEQLKTCVGNSKAKLFVTPSWGVPALSQLVGGFRVFELFSLQERFQSSCRLVHQSHLLQPDVWVSSYFCKEQRRGPGAIQIKFCISGISGSTPSVATVAFCAPSHVVLDRAHYALVLFLLQCPSIILMIALKPTQMYLMHSYSVPWFMFALLPWAS